MRLIYNILFLFFFCLSAPYYFRKMRRRGNWQEGFGQRFGHYDDIAAALDRSRPVIWLHAVSVGEVGLCLQLFRALEPRLPKVQWVVTTTTSTGMGELRKQLPAHVHKAYYPIDRRRYVRRALSAIHPAAVILVEAEVWPNFLWQLADRQVPQFLINARVSERSFKGYHRFGFLFQPLFAAFRAVGAQNTKDAQRLLGLGCQPDAVHVTGNLKFDAAKPDPRRLLDAPALLRQLGVPAEARVIVAGSTHDGEEAILAGQLLRLRKDFPDLFLVVVPRHFERTKQVVADLQTVGVRYQLRSEMTAETKRSPGEMDCLVVNTTGELKYFYECATVVFVGKSLTAEGGQNPIEPCALGKATVFGPNMQNFRAVVSTFRESDAVVQVRDAAELETTFAALLRDANRRAELGRNAQKVVQENQGAEERTVKMILDGLPAELKTPVSES